MILVKTIIILSSLNEVLTYVKIPIMIKRVRSSSSSSSSSIRSSINDEFYKRIGEPKYITAPMVSQSDLAFRLLTKKYGSDLCYTQMLHAKNFKKSNDFRKNHLDVYPAGTVIQAVPSQLEALGKKDKYYIEYGEDEEGPVMIQLAGHDGNVMKEAAMRILEQIEDKIAVAGIDVNLGCPQNIAKKGNYGAHLFTYDEDGSQVCHVLSSLNDILPSHIGLSAKIRLLPNLDHLPNRIQMMIDCGRLDILTIHGRTIKENKTKVRHANWDAIADIIQTFPNLPIIANGGIEYYTDLHKCLSHTNAKGVMSSEALLENPGIFSSKSKEDTALSPREMLDRQINYALEYLQLTLKYPPLPVGLGKAAGSFSVVRSHLFKILYRYLEEHTDLRYSLADCDTIYNIPLAIELVHRLASRYDTISDDELASYKSSNLDSSWYRRHRIVDGRFVHVRDNSDKSAMLIKNEKVLSVDERKELIRKRIQDLKLAKQEKTITNFI